MCQKEIQLHAYSHIASAQGMFSYVRVWDRTVAGCLYDVATHIAIKLLVSKLLWLLFET